MTFRASAAAALLVLLSLASCGTDSRQQQKRPSYDYTPPPAAAVPAGLEPATWTTHYTQDLLPYWTTPVAKGTPAGNFPTWRTMDGNTTSRTDRKPRMLGRQTFTYSIGYMLTGDEALLDLARAGTQWLLAHGRDASGAWHADLDVSGNATGSGAKFAQDTSYAVMGPASYFFVTADADAEAAVLRTRDLLFDPAKYWDAANGRIKDGLTQDLSAEAYMGAQGSWELVAQLDPITAFLLLVQPALSEQSRREQVLGDLKTLAFRIRDSFWKDGFVFGATGSLGSFGTRHTDFGHMLKAYWAMLQIDKRLDGHPLAEFVSTNAPARLTLAYDKEYGRWANRPMGDGIVQYGSDWWSYAEADQLAATLALHDPAWIEVLATTSKNFRENFVDRTRDVRELVPSIRRNGSWAFGWPSTDTAKCNEWKNGFHGAEHALVTYLVSHYLAGTPAPLYFAFPAARVQELAARATPYTFLGTVASVEDLGPLVGDATRHKVRVSFKDLR